MTVAGTTLSDAEQSWLQSVWQQELLDNARSVWLGYVDDNRQAVEARAEHLRFMAALAALVAGFDMVAMLQFSFAVSDQAPAQPESPCYTPPGSPSPVPSTSLLLVFGISNGLTVALTTCCMALCTMILGSVMKTGSSLMGYEEEELFIMQARQFTLTYKPGDAPPAPRRCFRVHWDQHCEAEWRRVLVFFSVGICCFLVNISLSGFIKFLGYQLPAVLLTVALGSGLAYFVGTSITWVNHLVAPDVKVPYVETPEPAGLPYDWHLPAQQFCTPPPTQSSFWTRLPELPDSAVLLQTEEAKRWLAEDQELQHLNNARWLWQSHVTRTRFELVERVEQLRSFSFLSSLVAGFAVASLLQVNLDPLQISHFYQMGYAVTVGLTATLTTCSMAMCSLVQMSIMKTGASLVRPEEENAFLLACRNFALDYRPGKSPPAPRRTFKAHWDVRCEGQWRRAFWMFSAGLLLLQINLIFACWIKFSPRTDVPTAETVILACGLVYLICGHVRWVRHLLGDASGPSFPKKDLHRHIVAAGLPWDWHRVPARGPQPVPKKKSSGSRLVRQLSRALTVRASPTGQPSLTHTTSLPPGLESVHLGEHKWQTRNSASWLRYFTTISLPQAETSTKTGTDVSPDPV